MPTRPLLTRYEDDLALFPDRWHRIGIVLASLCALSYPFLVDARWLSIGNLALVTTVGALGMMMLTGFSGQLSLGHAGFLATGAYTTAILGERLQLPFWLGILAGGLLAAAIGLLVGPFALRLKGLYLAIVTLGLLFMVNHTLHAAEDYTHGAVGIAVAAHGWFGGPAADAKPLVESATDFAFTDTVLIAGLTFDFERKLYFVFLLFALLTALCTKNLARSNTGRAMMAVRDHDIAAAVMGVNPARAKIVSFGLSSFFAGIAGGMFAVQQQYITIEPPFDLNMSVQYIAMIVLGGVGTVFGAVWGAIVFTVLSPLAESLFEALGPHLPMLSSLSAAQQATLLFSLVVVAFLILEPLGLLGLWLRTKRYFLAWPFRY